MNSTAGIVLQQGDMYNFYIPAGGCRPSIGNPDSGELPAGKEHRPVIRQMRLFDAEVNLPRQIHLSKSELAMHFAEACVYFEEIDLGDWPPGFYCALAVPFIQNIIHG